MASALPWGELLSRCSETARLSRQLNNVAPNHFEFSSNGSTVFFLGSTRNGGEQELLRIDIGRSQEPARVLAADWRQGAGSSKLSKEEELLRERLRASTTGISSYSYDAARDTIFFPAANELWRLPNASALAPKTGVPEHIVRASPGPVLDASMCPGDPDLIAFVRSGDLWVLRASTGIELRLTFCRRGDSDEAARVTAGQPSFIMQEEFDRYTGYWWQPAGSPSDTHRYILFEEVDERHVTQVPIMDYGPQTAAELFTFPRAGEANAITELKLIKLPLNVCRADHAHVAPALSIRPLGSELKKAFGWHEYIVRCGWLPDGQAVWTTLLDRNQSRLALVAIPVGSFRSSPSSASLIPTSPLQPTPSHLALASVLLEEISDIWVNATTVPSFFDGSTPWNSRFLWASERSGFNHVELIHAVCDSNMSVDHQALAVAETRRLPLTSGEWIVEPESVTVVPPRVFFSGTKDSAVQLHTYEVETSMASWQAWLQGAQELTSLQWTQPRRLTLEGFSHTTSVRSDGKVMIDVRSNASTPSVAAVVPIEPGSSNEAGQIFNTMPKLEIYVPPRLFSFNSKHGHTVHGLIFPAPESFSGPRPTILYVYGGPHVQLVMDDYRGLRYNYLSLYSQLGYNVVAFDSRGSSRRGLQFEGTARCKMGTFEIEDQVEGLEYLIASQPEARIDPKRIAVHGWSYGGYLSLQALCQRPDIFKASVAGAPVTMWEAYDTGYTERYMSLPQANQDGYKAGSVVENASKFPDEPDRLLIVHGLKDENVHFHHTAALVNALVAAGKPHRLQVYPLERHGIRDHVSRAHFQATLLHFLQAALA